MYIKIVSYFILFTVILKANITGTVFIDLPVKNVNSTLELNVYGVKESNERGIAGITVTAYPENISTVTNENGSWSLPVSVDSRVEYSNIPSYLKESPNSSSVQFVASNTTGILFGLHNPNDYVDTTNPFYVNNLQQNGTHIGSTLQALQTVSYDAQNLNADFSTYINTPGTGPTAPDQIVMEELGSVWGKAYQKNKKRLFIASMLQRHVGFAHTPADVYLVDYVDYLEGNSVSPVLEGYFSLQGIVPTNGGVAIDLGDVDRSSGPDYQLTDNPLAPNIDLDAYAKVGKISYGGIDIDYNSNTLWLLNLKQKGLISVDISGDINTFTSSTINQYLIDNLANVPTCTNGELRPWALKIHGGRGYVGMICDASISKNQDDLSAHVVSFDVQNPQNGFRNELGFDLNYTRQLTGWHAWEDTRVDLALTQYGTIYDEPILSDIEFDEVGNMYIAFMDRYATKLGNLNYGATSGETTANERAVNYGEILKICNTNGVYEREGTGSCLKQDYQDLYNVNIHEFFNDIGGGNELEPALGALATIMGSEQLLCTTLDPHPENMLAGGSQVYWNTQGVHTFSTVDGSIANWYSHAMTYGQGLSSKANGLGDVELISNPAPIEIGNRVWLDSNANGIQDANESGIADVQIDLVCNGAIVSTVRTNSAGEYIFSNDLSSNVSNTPSHQYGITTLLENRDNCYVSIPNIDGSNKQTVLNNHVLTSRNVGEGSNPNLNDSDAEVNSQNAKITITALDIPISGANNHSFDVGFKPMALTPIITPPTTPTVYSLGDTVWLDSNRDGIQDSNESGVNNITVNLYNSSDCSGAIQASTQTNSVGFYQFSNLSAGDYCIVFSNLPSNYTISTANQGANDALNSDANANAQITNIALSADDFEEDMGIYPTPTTTVVSGVSDINHTDGSCTCHAYESDSASTFTTMGLLLFMVLTSFVALLFKEELSQ